MESKESMKQGEKVMNFAMKAQLAHLSKKYSLWLVFCKDSKINMYIMKIQT